MIERIQNENEPNEEEKKEDEPDNRVEYKVTRETLMNAYKAGKANGRLQLAIEYQVLINKFKEYKN